MDKDKMVEWKEFAVEFLKENGPGFVTAILTLIIGFWLIARITRLVKRTMIKREMDESLIPFLSSLINFSLKALLLISVASMVGIATTSFVAILGAAGLAVGLALQGSLANFAGGVLILIFKPFKVGDLIQTQGELGNVKTITIFNTILTTPKGNTAILPNGVVANDKLVNYSKEPTMRVDLVTGIGYSEDIPKAKEVILEALHANPKVLKDPAPFVGVLELGDNSVNLAVRPTCKSEDYWDVYFDCYEATKVALDKANIEIPFPQRDLHIKSGTLS
ncbi:MAG: mechanosensitive ion channel [Bacteroidia bacterium]